jgi:hypothetical protein
MKSTPDKRYCKSREKFILISDRFENCIKSNQCFSDDPCPFQSEFEKQSQIQEKLSNKAQVGKSLDM